MSNIYLREFVPYAVSAFLVGLVGGFAGVLSAVVVIRFVRAGQKKA